MAPLGLGFEEVISVWLWDLNQESSLPAPQETWEAWHRFLGPEHHLGLGFSS